MGGPARSERRARRRLLGGTLSLASHAVVVLLLLTAAPKPPKAFDPQPVTVELLAPPAPQPARPKPARAEPAKARSARAKPEKARLAKATPAKTRPVKASPVKARSAPDRPRLARKRPSPRGHSALSAVPDDTVADAGADAGVFLSEAQLAGAAGAGAGGGSGSGAGGGGTCDIARVLQRALGRDALVRAAVAAYAGKAIMVWNGDWVRSPGEDGKGLAAVREAILWAVAFAPKACRSQPMHGLVVIALDQPRGTTRLAMGQGEWRWADLLTPRSEVR